jgi:peptidoglycan/LPS O-acetylase OafA/YrhL
MNGGILKNPNYMTQLDTLRTFAVASVAWDHWGSENMHFGIPWGVGVNLFFVVSGFLITGILLDCRWPALVENPQRLFSMRQFYIRRFLRIFPLYYMVLLALFVLNVEPVRETIFWHLLYGTNFYFVHHGGWHGQISHFWSLSVEEQFYIFWPFLVLFTPPKKLVPIIAGLILFSPAYRICMSLFFPSVKVPGVLAFANFDSLGMGALLALLRHPQIHFQPSGWLRRQRYLIRGLSFSAYVCIYVVSRTVWNSIWIGALEYTFLALFFACIVHAVSQGVHGIGGKILGFRPFLYLGKISYGIYVFHNLAGSALVLTLRILHIHWWGWVDLLPVRLFLMATWTVAASALSWHLVERPINNLKLKFPYVGNMVRVAAQAMLPQ